MEWERWSKEEKRKKEEKEEDTSDDVKNEKKRKLKLTGGPFLCSWNYDVLFHARGHLRGFFP